MKRMRMTRKKTKKKMKNKIEYSIMRVKDCDSASIGVYTIHKDLNAAYRLYAAVCKGLICGCVFEIKEDVK